MKKVICEKEKKRNNRTEQKEDEGRMECLSPAVIDEFINSTDPIKRVTAFAHLLTYLPTYFFKINYHAKFRTKPCQR